VPRGRFDLFLFAARGQDIFRAGRADANVHRIGFVVLGVLWIEYVGGFLAAMPADMAPVAFRVFPDRGHRSSQHDGDGQERRVAVRGLQAFLVFALGIIAQSTVDADKATINRIPFPSLPKDRLMQQATARVFVTNAPLPILARDRDGHGLAWVGAFRASRAIAEYTVGPRSLLICTIASNPSRNRSISRRAAASSSAVNGNHFSRLEFSSHELPICSGVIAFSQAGHPSW